MRTEAFDFDLPAERIALRPISPRDAARLLIVRPRPQPPFADCHVPDLPDLLSPGDALVVKGAGQLADPAPQRGALKRWSSPRAPPAWIRP